MARKDLASKVAFFRNAPTIFIVLGREAEQFRRSKDNTQLKQILKILNKLQEPVFWLYAVGYTQILDIVSTVSVCAQSVGAFPTSVYGQLLTTMEELESLGESWQWKPKLVCETNIGSPQSIVQKLRNGIFQPEISQIARNRAAGDMNARRRHMTGEGDYVPLAPDDV